MIYDCFTFFDETDMLELRLRTLEGVVDRFVLVEADVTFQGVAKPLHYSENAARYSRWSDRIIYVRVTDMPDTDNAWNREHYQRRAILRGLDGAADDALIIIADVDEIPRPEVLQHLENQPISSPVSLRMNEYYYFANVLMRRTCDATKVVRRGDLADVQALRVDKGLTVIRDAGWHFSYLMDRDRIQRKLASFSHVEYTNDRYMSPLHIERSMRFGVRLFGGGVNEIVPANDLPAMLTADPRYAKYLHPGLAWYEWPLARAYALTTSCRDLLPNELTDRRPVLAFLAAVPIAGFRRGKQFRRGLKAKLAKASRFAKRRLVGA